MLSSRSRGLRSSLTLACAVALLSSVPPVVAAEASEAPKPPKPKPPPPPRVEAVPRRQESKRTMTPNAEREAAAEAKRQRKAAKRMAQKGGPQ